MTSTYLTQILLSDLVLLKSAEREHGSSSGADLVVYWITAAHIMAVDLKLI
jgi:hypothetical protein